MKSGSIFWGAFLVFLGVFFLLDNFDIIQFKLSEMFKFWPFLLIVWGITLLKIPDYIKQILAGLSGLFLAVIVISIFNLRINDFIVFSINDKEIENMENDTSGTYFKYSESLNIQDSSSFSDVEADLLFDAGAGKFIFCDTTSQLVEVFSAYNSSEVIVQQEDNYAKVIIEYGSGEIQVNSVDELERLGKNRFAKVKMNNHALWNLEIDAGAANLDLNLKKHRVKNIEIDAGVSDINIDLGDLYHEINLDLETGVSNIKIKIPKNSGCKIITETVLSNNKFSGFDRINKNEYSTPDFNSAENKIFIRIEGALTDFKINRY